ncbi:signal-transducing adaptor protein 1-like [Stigmatopora argus]
MNRRQSYYEGYLEKRSFKDKKSRKMWTCLSGNTLYFYNDKRDSDPTEKLDLNGLVTIADDNTLDHNLDVAKLNLQTQEGIVKICAPNAENREFWKGLIQSVAELSVPSMLNLLPGQIRILEDVVEKEKERLRHVQQHSPVPGNDLSPDMPNCFHPVSRVEAELLLEKENSRGNLLLRRSRSGNGFAISTREEMNRPIFKHYHVSPTQDDRFSIDVDDPVLCTSLHEVVNYFLEATEGALETLVREETYEKNIYYVSSDNENGERRVRGANSSMHAPPQGFHPKQALSKLPSGEEEDNVYVNENIHENSTVEPSPEPETKEVAGKLAKAPIQETKKTARKLAKTPTPDTKTTAGKLAKVPTPDTKTTAGKLAKAPTPDTKTTAGKLAKAPTPDTKTTAGKSPKALTADAKTPTPAPRKTQPPTTSSTLKASPSKDNKMKHQTEANQNATISELKQKFERNPK